MEPKRRGNGYQRGSAEPSASSERALLEVLISADRDLQATTADAISLRFVDSAGQEIQFVAGTTELLPGSNTLQISCSVSTLVH